MYNKIENNIQVASLKNISLYNNKKTDAWKKLPIPLDSAEKYLPESFILVLCLSICCLKWRLLIMLSLIKLNTCSCQGLLHVNGHCWYVAGIDVSYLPTT